MPRRNTISIVALLTTGCMSDQFVGGLLEDDGGGSTGAGGTTSTTTGTTTTGTTTTGTDASSDDGVAPAICERPPFQCASTDLCDGDCGSVTSQWDENGCPRASCSSEDDCAADEACFRPGAWGLCAASAWGCDLEDGTCQCGATLDCSEDAAYCIPDEIAPPSVEHCIPPNPQFAFVFIEGGSQPPPIFDGYSGTSTCIVLTPPSKTTLELRCTGDFHGDFTLFFNAIVRTPLSQGQEVTFEYWSEAKEGWLNQWLRVTSDVSPFVPIVAVQADALTPPGAPDPFWPTGVEVAVGDIGCLTALCGEESGSFTGRSLRVGPERSAIDLVAGEGAVVLSELADVKFYVTVAEAREGACGESLADQQAWYAYTIQQSD